MNITAKTRYGLKALMDIAYHHRVGPVQRRHIAVRQGIPTDYMDQILMRLRNKGLIHSLRGREGGYHLALEPEEISVWDIVEAVEDAPYSVDRETSDPLCAYATECITEPAWETVFGTLKKQLKKFSLSTLLEEAEERILERGFDPIDTMENRPGRNAGTVRRTVVAQSS